MIQTREVAGARPWVTADLGRPAPAGGRHRFGGYSDGLPANAVEPRAPLGGDTPCPLVGRVSMDLITVDITDLPEVPRSLDILGPHQGVDRLAESPAPSAMRF